MMITKPLSYKERANLATHPITKQLFQIIEEKKTNLAHNPDVTISEEFLKIADKVGPHICILKTHIDMLSDFHPDVITELQKIAEKHNFLIFEDRKFIDIGSVAFKKYQGGTFKIADWAHLISANHIMPGPGVIRGLASVGVPKGRALLLLTEMSSEGALKEEKHRRQSVNVAEEHADFVIGFICQRALTDDPTFLHFTSGVQKAEKEDYLDQQYRTPEVAIREQGNDVMIVGRGIYRAEDPAYEAHAYQEAGWNAYLRKLGD